MSQGGLLVAALIARGLAIVVNAYADWLLYVMREGVETSWQVLTDAGHFLHYLQELVAHQVFGYESAY